MANKYERLWKPEQKVDPDEEFEMPWRENQNGPEFGDEAYHISGQMVEIENAARNMIPVLTCLNPQERSEVIDSWIAGDTDTVFATYMADFLEKRDVYRLLFAWGERTSPFLFMAKARLFDSREQYQSFVAKIYDDMGLEPRDFDENSLDDDEPGFREDWITFVK